MIVGFVRAAWAVSQPQMWICGRSGGESKQIWVISRLEEGSCHTGTRLLVGCSHLEGRMHGAFSHTGKTGRLLCAWPPICFPCSQYFICRTQMRLKPRAPRILSFSTAFSFYQLGVFSVFSVVIAHSWDT